MPSLKNSSLHLIFNEKVGAIQFTIKYGKQFFVLDGISNNALFSELLALLQARLGSKVTVNARLMKTHRSLRMNEAINEVCST